jgi:hypothetical protein
MFLIHCGILNFSIFVLQFRYEVEAETKYLFQTLKGLCCFYQRRPFFILWQ